MNFLITYGSSSSNNVPDSSTTFADHQYFEYLAKITKEQTIIKLPSMIENCIIEGMEHLI